MPARPEIGEAMTTLEQAPEQHEAGHSIEVGDENLVFRQVVVTDRTPTGNQISHAAGFSPMQQTAVLQFLSDGDLAEIRPNQSADLSAGVRFVVVETDRLYFLTINGERFDWPSRTVAGEVIRKLGDIAPED